MEHVYIYEPTLVCNIILDNLLDAENADLSECEHPISNQIDEINYGETS